MLQDFINQLTYEVPPTEEIIIGGLIFAASIALFVLMLSVVAESKSKAARFWVPLIGFLAMLLSAFFLLGILYGIIWG